MKRNSRDKKKIKELRKTVFYLCSSIVILFICIIILTYTLYKLFPPNHKTFRIAFAEGFTDTEKNDIYSVLNELRPEYMEGQRQVQFIKELNLPLCGGKIACYGANWEGDDMIYVQYFPNNTQLFKLVLCHELLHTYMDSPHEESLVDRISKFLPCYQDNRTALKYFVPNVNITVETFKYLS